MRKLYIVGFGMGSEELLTCKAKNIIKSADRVLTTTRLSLKDKDFKNCTLSEIYSELAKGLVGVTVVIVSGDTGFFSASKSITEKFNLQYEIELVNGLSSLQYFSGKLGLSYDNTKVLSMHGRNNSIIPYVSYNRKLFVLTGGKNKVDIICKDLVEYGLGNVSISVGENLSYENERIVTRTALEMHEMVFEDLSVMYIENNNFVVPNMPMVDSDFIRDEVPMTKEEVRWVCIQKLGLVPSDIVYDIGAGTGSIAIEMAKKVHEGFVYAIEQKETACDLIKQNIEKHKTFNVRVVCGKAPSSMEGLPVPSKAVIGGSTGNMKEIVNNLVSINENIKIVATAITLETVHDILESFKEFNLEFDTISMNISKGKKVGGYNMMIANNPIYVITGQRNNYE